MSTKRARMYFEKTDKSLLQEIYDYFEPDFKLFQYSIKEFIWKFMFNFFYSLTSVKSAIPSRK